MSRPQPRGERETLPHSQQELSSRSARQSHVTPASRQADYLDFIKQHTELKKNPIELVSGLNYEMELYWRT